MMKRFLPIMLVWCLTIAANAATNNLNRTPAPAFGATIDGTNVLVIPPTAYLELGGVRRTTWPDGGSGTGTTTQQVLDITGPLYYPLSSNPSSYVTAAVTNGLPTTAITNGLPTLAVVSNNFTTLGQSVTFSNWTLATFAPIATTFTNGGFTINGTPVTNGGSITVAGSGNGYTNTITFGGGGSIVIEDGLVSSATYTANVSAAGSTGLFSQASLVVTNIPGTTVGEASWAAGTLSISTNLTAAQISAAGGLTNGQGGTVGAITNGQTGVTLAGQFKNLLLGLPPGAALVYGSTNDATLVGFSGANSYHDELQFSDATEQRARYVIPAATTTRWNGGVLTNTVLWRGTATTGAVVWQIGMIGRTNETLMDVAYQNSTIVTSTVSSTASNLVSATITMTPTNATAGALWLMELRRIPSNGGDTMVGDARVVDWSVKE